MVRVRVNGRRNIKLDLAGSGIGMDLLSRDFTFSAIAWAVRRGSHSLAGWPKHGHEKGGQIRNAFM